MLRSPVVVGRDGELEAIWRALDDAGAGQGGCVLLLGEAGSGKTRLLREAREEARRRGMGVLAGSVPPAIASPAFGILAQALRSWTRSHPVPEAELAPFALGLHQVLPEWPLPPDPPDLPASQMRLLVVEGILRLMLLAARERGAIVLLDDLHDADPETFEFLHHASDSIGVEPLLILGAVRSREHRPGEARARALGRAGQATLLEVGHLDDAGVAAMVEAVLEAPPPRELIIDLLARTDGVPLLVEEMLAAHLAAGTVRRENGSVHWSAEPRAVVPETIVEIVRERLDRLAADDRLPLLAGAILGRFDPALLAPITALDPATLAAHLQRAAQEGLVELAGSTVAFRHGLIRDAVVESVPPLQRAELHRRAAEALDSLHGEDPEWLEERAHHRQAMGEDDQAAQLLVRAARRSLARAAPASAEAVLLQATELARSAATVAEAREVLVETLGAVGRWEEAIGLDRQLLASQGESASRLVRMSRNAVRSLGARGSTAGFEEAKAFITRAAEAGAEPAGLGVLSAWVNMWGGDLEGAVRAGREALSLAEAAEEGELICSALDITGRVLASMGHFEEAAVMFRRWAALAEGAGLRMSHLQALMELGNVEFMAGVSGDGLEAARELAREAGAYTTLVLADLSLGWWLRPHAKLEEAVAVGEEAVALCRRLRLDLLPQALVSAGSSLNAVAWGSGEALLAEGLSLAPEDADVLIAAEISRGETALRAGLFDRAEVHLARAAATMQLVPWAVQGPASCERVGALLALGRTEEAEAALEEARALPGLRRVYYMPMFLAAAEALVGAAPSALEKALAPAVTNAPLFRALLLVLGAQVLGGPSATGWLREALPSSTQPGPGTTPPRRAGYCGTWASGLPESGTPRRGGRPLGRPSVASARPSCSPTSSVPRRLSRCWATTPGGTCCTGMT